MRTIIIIDTIINAQEVFMMNQQNQNGKITYYLFVKREAKTNEKRN